MRRVVEASALALAWAFSASCGSERPTPTPEPRAIELSFTARVSPDEAATVSHLVVWVSAPDIQPSLVYNFDVTNGSVSATLSVPVGRDRTLRAQAYNPAGIETHEGARNFDVLPTGNTSTTLVLEPLTGTVPITVQLGTRLVTITPATSTLRVGQTQSMTAIVTDQNGSDLQVPGSDISWATASPALVSITADGQATGVKEGQAKIVAVWKGIAGTAAVSVVPSPTIVAAGDIAQCGVTGDEQTAALIDQIAGPVLAIGDLAYEDGSILQFATCYDPSWGRFRSRTVPVPGNHEYHQPGAAPYFQYFGATAGDPAKGYYYTWIGAWLVIAINSEVEMPPSHLGTSPQVDWVKSVLAKNPASCVLAFWHRPRFSSGVHGNASKYQPYWQALYDAGADVVLNGHDHDYERFAPQKPNGAADPAKGVVEFVVGTGGGGQTTFNPDSTRPNSLVRVGNVWGVLKMTLHERSYDWQFLSTPSGAVLDQGSASCH